MFGEAKGRGEAARVQAKPYTYTHIGLRKVAVHVDLGVWGNGLCLDGLLQHHHVRVLRRVVPPHVLLRLKVQRDDPPGAHEGA